MRRTWSSVAPLALVAALVTGCGSAAPYAARVNDERISDDELEGELDAIRGNQQYREALEQGNVQVSGEGEGTFASSFVASVLNRQILLKLVNQEVRDRNLTVSDEQRAQAEGEVRGNLQESFDQFPESYRRQLVERQAEVATLQAAVVPQQVDEAQVRRVYDEQYATTNRTCVSHILVDTPQRASALRARLVAGEDFGAIARAESRDDGRASPTDPDPRASGQPPGGSAGRGGELGCATDDELGSFVPEFRQAAQNLPVGEFSQPVTTSFGAHLIRVTSRGPTPFDQARPEIEQQLRDPNSAFTTFLETEVREADVDVNPRYGRFEKDGQGQGPGGVVPPEAPRVAPDAPGAGPAGGDPRLVPDEQNER